VRVLQVTPHAFVFSTYLITFHLFTATVFDFISNSADIYAATFPQLFMLLYLCMANRICFTDKNFVRKWKLLLRSILSNGVDRGDILPTKFNSFMPLPSHHFI